MVVPIPELVIDGWVLVPSRTDFERIRDTSSLRVGILGSYSVHASRRAWTHLFGKPVNDGWKDFEWPIPHYYVHSVEQYDGVVAEYEGIARRFGLELVWRGQYDSYLDASGFVNVTPAGLRGSLSGDYLNVGSSKQLNELLDPWVRVLEDSGIAAGSGVHDELWQDDHVVVWSNQAPAVRIATNPFLLALAMHYGFPTPALDVTPDSSVAAWFAVHAAVTTSTGATRYRNADQSTDNPTVYAFLQPKHEEWPVYFLASLQQLQDIALRPFRQSAAAMPYMTFGGVRGPSLSGGWGTVRRPSRRFPSAAIAVRFSSEELAACRGDITNDFLFPADDPLYRALERSGAPNVAVYSS